MTNPNLPRLRRIARNTPITTALKEALKKRGFNPDRTGLVPFLLLLALHAITRVLDFVLMRAVVVPILLVTTCYREARSRRQLELFWMGAAAVVTVPAMLIVLGLAGASTRAFQVENPAVTSDSAYEYMNYQGETEEDDQFPTREQIDRYYHETAVSQIGSLMVGNYVSIGTPIDGYENGGDEEDRARYAEALVMAQTVIDELPDKWVLPEKVYIQLSGQNRVPLDAEQMEVLREIYGYFTRGFGVMPNYLDGLPPHVAAGIAGNAAAECSLRNTGTKNGHFGTFQLGGELYSAYKAWCTSGGNTVIHDDVWHQTAFVWDVLNGWGYGTYVTVDYSQTLADLLAAETAAEAATIFNAGKDGDPTDGVDGFERGANNARRVEWAEQIYAQLLAVRP